MRELPIPFSTSMVQAIRAGRKTMTRRVMNPQPHEGYDAPILITETEWGFRKPSQGHMPFFATPRYQVGDHLWVKETYADLGNDTILYKADWTAQELKDSRVGVFWKSGRFMFKKYARIWLEVTAVKAERLQEISEDEALAEGTGLPVAYMPKACQQAAWSERQVFQRLWDSINGKVRPEDRVYTLDDQSNRHFVPGQIGRYAWAANPWVWAYTFKVLP